MAKSNRSLSRVSSSLLHSVNISAGSVAGGGLGTSEGFASNGVHTLPCNVFLTQSVCLRNGGTKPSAPQAHHK